MLNIVTDNHQAPSRWVDLVRQGGYLSPEQRQAFDRAIQLVNNCLRIVLTQKHSPHRGAFEFDMFVDLLEQDFLNHADLHSENGLHSDVAQTAYWVARKMADHLIAARQATASFDGVVQIRQQ
ncbi:DNA-binding protein [Brenneria rubrifaciens]|uniref:DNA-binding protein n=1 Tax=Brenneria rubrifaciens TaxID=55213 RepID=A0A4P8QN24_9GAMM|nr:DNA-binding protein [Brenneria rubrifaciens]QCR08552.1 DNA-binding protein [Brenneria rubrifaciens]